MAGNFHEEYFMAIKISLIFLFLAFGVLNTMATNSDSSSIQKKTVLQKTKGKVCAGRPVFIDDENRVIVIEDNKKKLRQFIVRDSAAIFKNGASVPMNELDKKMPVSIMYSKSGRLAFAKMVEQNIP